MGIAVPSQLSVIGFDDVPESARTTPPLTTVRQPIQEMGAAGIRLLISLIEGTTVDETHIQLPTSLVERGSTGPR